MSAGKLEFRVPAVPAGLEIAQIAFLDIPNKSGALAWQRTGSKSGLIQTFLKQFLLPLAHLCAALADQLPLARSGLLYRRYRRRGRATYHCQSSKRA